MQKYLKYIGYFITAVSFIYIYYSLKDTHVVFKNDTGYLYVFIVLFCIANSVLPFFSAYIWKLSLQFVSNKNITHTEVFSIYIKSNLAKYLPGNVMQYVGRNYLGKKYGWSHTQLTISSVLEIVFIIVLPFLLLLLLYLSNLWKLPAHYQLTLKVPFENQTIFILISLILTILSIVGFLYFKKRKLFLDIIKKAKVFLPLFLSTRFLFIFLKMALTMLITFFYSGYIFYTIAKYILGIELGIENIINITCAITIASYSSVLTPGVPGGIGIKESISVLLLSAYGYNKADMMLICITSRFFSICGDVLAFLNYQLYDNRKYLIAKIKNSFTG